MSTKMFVNLPVRDLPRSMTFFQALGFTFNRQFSDETAACMVISQKNYAMLLTEAKWKQLIPRPIADTSQGREMVLCLSCESKDEVITLVGKALAAGGTRLNDPKDHGFMFEDGFQDLDGHLWSFFWMDPSHVQPAEQ